MKNNPFILGLIGALVFAHQPVMDMAPRWNGGYGFQVRYERFGSTVPSMNKISSLAIFNRPTGWRVSILGIEPSESLLNCLII